MLKLFLYVFILSGIYNIVISQSLTSNYQLKTKEDAYNQAIAYTGFSKKTYSYKALAEENISLRVLEKENIPVLQDSVIGKDVWVVTFNNVKLDLSGWIDSYVKNQKRKTYKVFLNAQTGTLIKIIGQTDTTKPFFFDKYSKESLVKSLDACSEKWVSFPDTTPPVTFEMALQAAVASSPLMADEIYGVCVNFSDLNKAPKLIWSIIGNGIPKDSRLGTKARSVVDAKTGQALFFCNYP